MRKLRVGFTGMFVMASCLYGTATVGTAAAASNTNRLTCGTPISHNTTLHADVGPCSGDGLVVTKSGVHLNLNGHRVFGHSAFGQSAVGGSFAGIRLQSVHGVTVDGHGSVASFDAGVIVSRGRNNTVKDLNVHDNNDTQYVADSTGSQALYGDGIVVLSSSYNLVTNNKVHDNGPFSGITVLAETDQNPGPNLGSITGPAPAGNVIHRNDVIHNDVPDVCPSNGQGGQAPSGTCNPGAPVYNEDIGIRIEGPQASHTTVSNNRASWNGRTGISPLNTFGKFSPPTANIPPNTDTVIVHNDVEHDGIATTIYDNDPTIGPVEGDGIFNRCYKGSPQQGCPVRTVIVGNTVNHNTASGIDLQVSKGTTVEDNVALYNNRDYTQTFVSQHNASGPYDDGTDVNPGCDNNIWLNNVLGTISQACVEHHIGASSMASPQAAAARELDPSMPLAQNDRRHG